jgi:endonuclease/exonuclease/phosphatase family metal-dependent hydrolase
MKRLLTGVGYLSSGLLLSILILQGCATARLDTIPPVQSYQVDSDLSPASEGDRNGRLRVMTLNLAHGRGGGFHQLLQRSETTIANLDAIASLIKEKGADVVALQEADGASFWSGGFNHVDYLAKKADFSYAVQGRHAEGIGLSYGTALISRVELRQPRAVTFDPRLSPVPKGFLVSAVSWPGNPGVDVDVVSLHLDFTSRSTRKKQAMQLIETLRGRNRPVIVMGDFNTSWKKDSTVLYISQALGLLPYNPEEPGLETFPRFGKRLDWILVSPGISFHTYRVVPGKFSDHYGVLAELVMEGDESTLELTEIDQGR